MVRAGCVFVAGIHPSRTWTSGSFESVRWNAYVHRLDLGLYSHPKEFWGGMEFQPMLTPREKSPLPENIPRGGSNPWRCGQRAQALPTELFRPPKLRLSSHYYHMVIRWRIIHIKYTLFNRSQTNLWLQQQNYLPLKTTGNSWRRETKR